MAPPLAALESRELLKRILVTAGPRGLTGLYLRNHEVRHSHNTRSMVLWASEAFKHVATTSLQDFVLQVPPE